MQILLFNESLVQMFKFQKGENRGVNRSVDRINSSKQSDPQETVSPLFLTIQKHMIPSF